MLVTAETHLERCLGTSKPEKPPKFRCFSHQAATVGLSIVNQSYHAHDRALHCGARRPVKLKQTVLQGYWELEALLQDSACRRCELTFPRFLAP